jgi:hypothetical protein
MIIPQTRPLGFCKATTRPKPRAEAMVAGTWARATCCATVATWCVAGSSSSRRRNVSAVRPDGPGAARLRLQRRFWMMVAMGSSAGCSGWKVVIWSSGGSYSAAGRRLGSRNSSRVCCVHGAVGPAVSACRAAESSPKCTRWRARSALCWGLG